MANIWLRAIKTGVPIVIAARTELMSAWEGSTCACFFVRATTNPEAFDTGVVL